MSTTFRHRNLDAVYRLWVFSQYPVIVTSPVVTGTTAANTAILEVPYVGRRNGAVQVYTADGSAFVATFKIQGTLMEPDTTLNPVSGVESFLKKSVDADYSDIATVSASGITQLPADSTYGRVRVICTSFGSGIPQIRML